MSRPTSLNGAGVDLPRPIAGGRVLTASRAFTGEEARHLADAAVVVEGTRIAWVGVAADLPRQYRELPAESFGDATILPGLVETHAHLVGHARHGGPEVPDPGRHRPAWETLSAVAVARQLASVGVTTVQSLGAPDFVDVALREAIAEGFLDGPRIVASGPQLTTTGGHAWSTGGEVDSLDGIRQRVRDHHKAGVDLIKMMATGGFMTYGTAPWNAQFTTAELRALGEEAHRLGKHTAAHAHGTQGIRRAVEAGIDYIAHGSFVDTDGITRFDPGLADEIAERGIFVDIASPPSFPPVAGETWSPRAYELYSHGVKLVTGHDIGAVLPPSGYTFGLRQLAASGLPNAEVLFAATSRAAAAAGLAGVTGALVPGYEADLLVVAGDPLADLAVLDHRLRIVLRGRDFAPDPVPAFDRGARLAGPTNGQSPGEARNEWRTKLQRALDHPLPQVPIA